MQTQSHIPRYAQVWEIIYHLQDSIFKHTWTISLLQVGVLCANMKKIKIRAVKNSHTTWNSLCLLDRVLGSIWILSSYCSYHTVYWNIFFHFHYVCWSAEHRGFIYILHLNSDCSWVLEWAQVEESRVHMSIGSFHFQNIQVFIFEIQCLGRGKKEFERSVRIAVACSQMSQMSKGMSWKGLC